MDVVAQQAALSNPPVNAQEPKREPSEVRGEGDYGAARHHRESVESFVKPGEADGLIDAEHVGASHLNHGVSDLAGSA